MKSFKIISCVMIALFLSSFTSVSSNGSQGIKFEKISFKEALKQAKKEHKLIFVDAYTTWCGPCKMMAKSTFTAAEVGKAFNKSFINLQIDMERGEGLTFARTYRVRAYPSLFLINAEGKVEKRMLGYMQNDKLLEQVKDFVK